MFSSSSWVICISFFKNFLSVVSVSRGDSSSTSLTPKILMLLRRLKHSCLIIRRSSSFILTISLFKLKNDHRSKFSNLSNWKEEAWKIQGFSGIRTRDLRDTGAMLYQLSYEATHWERGQFIEFISPVRSEMMSSICEIIHIFELRLFVAISSSVAALTWDFKSLTSACVNWRLCFIFSLSSSSWTILERRFSTSGINDRTLSSFSWIRSSLLLQIV